MQIADLYRLKLVSSPQVSPDGKQVLFVLNAVDRKRDDYQDRLCTVPTGGGRVARLPTKSPRNQAPSWSPDGKRVAFVSGDAGEKLNRLSAIDVARGRVSTLCEMPNAVEKPSWSPDGKRILFLSRVRVDKEQINHRSDVKIVKHLWYKFTTTGWFQDTRKHAFVADSRGGAPPSRVTGGEFDVASACWMPDGERIAFSANMTEDTDTSIYKDVWISPAGPSRPSRTRPTKVTDGGWQIDAVSVMPRDSTILFVGREIPDESLITQKKSDVWAIRQGKGSPVKLTEGFDQWVVPFHSVIPGWSESPKFTADPPEVYFTANENGSVHVFKVGLEGSRVQRVTGGKVTVSSFSVAGDGRVAFVSSDSSHAPELWVLDGGDARQLTRVNAGFVTQSNFSQPEEFWFTASDGARIQGWMIRPLGLAGNRKCPALLSIHGGPYSAYSHALTEVEHEFQVLAAAGFAVFYTNPRGSLGYGEKFTEDISGHWAERDFTDMMESVDHVIATFPFVDANRLGVFGGSYGGYMTNWAISHTDRFKAALSDRCVSNVYSFAGVFDLAGFQWSPKHDVGRGKDPWDAPELYLEKSPVHHIKNVNTPLMLLHSDSDWSTTLDNAEQMFVGLKRLKKEAKMVIFPGENHFLSWTGRPAHRAERLKHYVQWFDEHLSP